MTVTVNWFLFHFGLIRSQRLGKRILTCQGSKGIGKIRECGFFWSKNTACVVVLVIRNQNRAACMLFLSRRKGIRNHCTVVCWRESSSSGWNRQRQVTSAVLLRHWCRQASSTGDERMVVCREDPFKNGKKCTLLSTENRGRLGPSRSQAGWWVFDCTHGADVRVFYYPLFFSYGIVPRSWRTGSAPADIILSKTWKARAGVFFCIILKLYRLTNGEI